MKKGLKIQNGDEGTRCKQIKTFKITIDLNHDQPIIPNLVKYEFEIFKFGNLGLTDIVYIRIVED